MDYKTLEGFVEITRAHGLNAADTFALLEKKAFGVGKLADIFSAAKPTLRQKLLRQGSLGVDFKPKVTPNVAPVTATRQELLRRGSLGVDFKPKATPNVAPVATTASRTTPPPFPAAATTSGVKARNIRIPAAAVGAVGLAGAGAAGTLGYLGYKKLENAFNTRADNFASMQAGYAQPYNPNSQADQAGFSNYTPQTDFNGRPFNYAPAPSNVGTTTPPQTTTPTNTTPSSPGGVVDYKTQALLAAKRKGLESWMAGERQRMQAAQALRDQEIQRLHNPNFARTMLAQTPNIPIVKGWADKYIQAPARAAEMYERKMKDHQAQVDSSNQSIAALEAGNN